MKTERHKVFTYLKFFHSERKLQHETVIFPDLFKDMNTLSCSVERIRIGNILKYVTRKISEPNI
jgi:hypothetical protein